MKSLKAFLLCVALLFTLNGLAAQNPDWLWAKKAGGTDMDKSKAIVCDSDGNTYVTGLFRGNATFGNTTLTSSGYEDVFVAKLDNEGNWLWATKAGGPTNDEGYAIALDSSGNIYVTGWSNYATMNFGNFQVIGGGVFIAKMDGSGNWLWARNATRPNQSGAGGYGIAVDSVGNAYVTGVFQTTVSFDGITLPCVGAEDIFVAKLDSAGNWLWTKSAGGQFSDKPYGIDLDNDGNIYLTGVFGDASGLATGTATFGSTTLTSNGSDDIFIAKMDSGGNWLWAKGAGGTKIGEEGRGIAVDSDANVYVTGYFRGPVAFGSTTLTPSSDVDVDVFVAKLDTGGNWLWAKRAGGTDTDSDYGYGIAVDSAANVYLTGQFFGTITFGATTPLVSSGDFDIYLAKLDNAGNWLWATKAGGTNSDNCDGIAVDGAGNVYLAGFFLGTAYFGAIPLTVSGGYDAFVAKLYSVVGVSDELNPPVIANTMSVWPNPFKQGTTLSVALDKTGSLGQDLRVSLYDLKGRKVRNLICGTSGGDELSLSWDGRDDGGVFCPNGIYLVKLFAGQRQLSSAKVTLIR